MKLKQEDRVRAVIALNDLSKLDEPQFENKDDLIEHLRKSGVKTASPSNISYLIRAGNWKWSQFVKTVRTTGHGVGVFWDALSKLEDAHNELQKRVDFLEELANKS